MNYSTNYSMREPVPGEKVKVADINYNTEIIDGVMLDNRQISIDMYDDTSTYNTDDLAGHENAQNRIAVYRCLEDNVTGTWDSTKWVQTNLADEITDIRGNAGASDLGDLGDVDITTPTDGQALLYDPTSSKWHNSDLPDADVTKTASGNPIEFEDGADAPLVKCTTTIQGYQEGTGTPSPENVRPIHVYTEATISGIGKNRFDKTQVTTGKMIGTDGNETSATNFNATPFISVTPSNNYVVSGINTVGYNPCFAWYKKDKSLISAHQHANYIYSQLTAPENAYYFRDSVNTNDLNTYQFEPGSAATTYEPFTRTDHTATWAPAIYQGNADLVGSGSPSALSEYKISDLGNLTWNMPSTGYFYADAYQADRSKPYVCEAFNYVGMYNAYTTQYFPNDGDLAYSRTVTNRFAIRCDAYTSAADFKAAVAGYKIAIPLATPETVQITVSNTPIKSLSGYNHIESSTGEMEIEYFPAKEQPLIDLIPEASNMHAYSTAEHAVGTWIDGKTVYEQTYSFTDAITVTTEWTSTGITSDGIDAIIDSVVGHTTGQTWNGMGCLKDGGYVKLANPYGGSIGINFLIIRYTKPTVTRSLAKGGGETEAPQEEQAEELKEEPTEEIKEEPTEEAKEEPVEEVKEEVKEEETKEEGEVNER